MFKKIYIEITNICNLKCKFCPETTRNKEYMSIENFEEIISKIHNHTKLVCLHVKGEPLLHNQLGDILKILEKYNLKANITTNGTLIKQKLETIKNSKAVRQINFSIHSINENEVNSNIIKLIENYYNIQNLKQQLIENNFIQLRKNIFINQDTEFTWPDINKKAIIEKGRCLALKEQIAILVDGTVVPCYLDNNGGIPLGNIFEENLEDILQKTKSIEIKKNFENSIITCELCKTCGFLKRLENKRSMGKVLKVM